MNKKRLYIFNSQNFYIDFLLLFFAFIVNLIFTVLFFLQGSLVISFMFGIGSLVMTFLCIVPFFAYWELSTSEITYKNPLFFTHSKIVLREVQSYKIIERQYRKASTLHAQMKDGKNVSMLFFPEDDTLVKFIAMLKQAQN